MYKIFASFSVLHVPCSQMPYFENRQFMIGALRPQLYIANSVMDHFVHTGISNIRRSYGHLKWTRPVASKSKVARQGSRCGVCVGVSRNQMGVSRSRGCSNKFSFFVSAPICICKVLGVQSTGTTDLPTHEFLNVYLLDIGLSFLQTKSRNCGKSTLLQM